MQDPPIEPEIRATRAATLRARRRRRRIVGTVVFVVVAVGVLAAAVLTFAGSGGSGGSGGSAGSAGSGSSGNDQAAPTQQTRVGATTTTAPLPPAGPFALTDGVNVRAGPGITYPSAGTLTTGTKVMVVCVITGDTVNGPKGPTNLWVRVTGTTPVGYITNEYVDTGPTIDDRSKIPLCPGI